jgi:hypothetical protein
MHHAGSIVPLALAVLISAVFVVLFVVLRSIVPHLKNILLHLKIYHFLI